METGEKYKFSVHESLNGYTKITSVQGDTYRIPVEIIDRTEIELIYIGVKQKESGEKIFFTQEHTEDRSYEYNNIYKFTIEQILSDNTLECSNRSGRRLIKIKRNDTRLYEIGDVIICRVISIFFNEVNFAILTFDFNNIFKAGNNYRFPIIEKEDDDYIYFSIKGKICKVRYFKWIKRSSSLNNEINVTYNGDGKWGIIYENVECDLFEIDKSYQIRIVEITDKEFYRGVTLLHNTEVQVIRPFVVSPDNEIIGNIYDYKFNGVDKKTDI